MKILIIRFSSIGDIVLTSPVLRCLAEQKKAELHFLTKPQFVSLVEHNIHIHRVHAFAEFKETLASLKSQEFDLVIDLHNNLRSQKIKRGLAVKSYSYKKMSVKRFLLTKFKFDLLKGNHVVDRYFTAVKRIGVTNDGRGLDFYFPIQSLPDLPEKFILIAIGTAHYTKNLPAKMIEELCFLYDLPIVLIGGKEHYNFISKINLPQDKQILNLVGKTSLLESAQIISNSSLVISPDTGMLHIAAAQKKPLVAVYGSTSSKLGFTPYMDKEKYVIVENNDLSCRPCTKQGRSLCPKGHFKCMNDIKSSDIVDKSEQLIDL